MLEDVNSLYVAYGAVGAVVLFIAYRVYKSKTRDKGSLTGGDQKGGDKPPKRPR